MTLNGSADAWIDQGSPTANKGGDSILKVMSKSGGNLRGLVRFLLPAMPAGCKVDVATLRLYASAARDGRTVQALRLAAAWSENTVTWGNAPATTGAAATTSSGTGYREWNVATHAQAMYDSGAHDGWLIRDASENQDAEQQFHSREKGSNLPQLVLRFTPAAPPPPPPPPDTTPPETTIGSGPSNPTSATDASFNFSASETGSTFECRLDSSQPTAFAACTNPKTYSGLQAGSHSFEVRGRDAAGNADQTPAVLDVDDHGRARRHDGAADDDRLRPARDDDQHERVLRLLRQRESVDLRVQARRGRLRRLHVAGRATGLSVGAHTFEVRATDAAGNTDLTPASQSWTVEAPPPPDCGSATTVGANADSWIDQGSPANNNGSDSTLKVMSKNGGALRVLVRFTLPTVPQGCVVDTARLRLYAGSAKENRTIQVLRLDGAWTESGVNWGNQPATAGPAATVASGAGAGWREWNVAAQAEAMRTGSNHGFLIRDANEGEDAEQQYNSREKSSDRPELVLTFRPGP